MLEPFFKLRKKCHITFIVNKFYNYNTNFNIYIIFNKTIILILIYISKTRYKRTSSLISHTPFPITPHPCIYRELIKSFVLHVYNSHEEFYKCRIVIKCQNCRKKNKYAIRSLPWSISESTLSYNHSFPSNASPILCYVFAYLWVFYLLSICFITSLIFNSFMFNSLLGFYPPF